MGYAVLNRRQNEAVAMARHMRDKQSEAKACTKGCCETDARLYGEAAVRVLVDAGVCVNCYGSGYRFAVDGCTACA